MPEMSTPAWYVEYFYQFTISEYTQTRNWAAGLQAAELWQQYHDTGSTNPVLLHDIVPILMPLRYEGSGFYDFWRMFLWQVGTLPVNTQLPLWYLLFDIQYHGQRAIVAADQAASVLKLWYQAVHLVETGLPYNAVTDTIIEQLYPYFRGTDEWQALLFALDRWIQQVQPQRPLIDRIAEKINTHDA